MPANSALRATALLLALLSSCALDRTGLPAASGDSDADSDSDTASGTSSETDTGGTDADSDSDSETGSPSESDTESESETGRACPGEGDPCYEGAPGTSGTGECADGAIACPADVPECVGDVVPIAEACNALDDDCDGTADEDFECVQGTAGLACAEGACAGTADCDLACTLGACAIPGAGDDCPAAIDVSGGGVFEGTTCGAGDDLDRCGGGAGAPETLYAFTIQGETHVTATVVADGWSPTVTLWDGVLAADCPGSDEALCGADDDGDGDATFDETFLCTGACPDLAWIAVDGMDADDQGDFTLTVTVTPPGGCGAQPFVDGVASDTCAQGDDWRGSCGGTSTSGSDLAYWFTVDSRRDVTFETCDDAFLWDSIVYVTDQCDDDGGETRNCNDDGAGCGDRSSVTSRLDPGLYYVVVDSPGFGICGQFELSSDL